MMRHCDGSDPNLRDRGNNPCTCGQIFDDVSQSVIYPHASILSREEKDAILESLGLL